MKSTPGAEMYNRVAMKKLKQAFKLVKAGFLLITTATGTSGKLFFSLWNKPAAGFNFVASLNFDFSMTMNIY